MSNESRSSRFTYSSDEQELMKVIALSQNEVQVLHANNHLILTDYDSAILKAEDIARKRGVTDEQMAFLRFQAENSPNTKGRVSELNRTWSEIVAEADQAILGDLIMEDICSGQDFENATHHISDIENEFKIQTRLTNVDLAFIPIAIALQCLRQYVLQPFLDANRLTHKQGDGVKKIVPKSWQELLCGSVPYDATTRLDKTSEKTGLGGTTHRYRTLGHDPVLGWFFGPANILSDSLTKTDFITSYAIQDMKIASPISTLEVITNAREQAKTKFNLTVSVIRQAIHFGSDYFTKQGLPIPFISSVNNDVSKFLISNNINMLNVTEGIAFSTFINFMISCIHKLFYNESTTPELYEVRTRKILSISNTIASASNVAYVAITKNAKVLDLGGLLVTIRRLCTDLRFIARVKQEFIEGKLDAEWKAISEDIDRLCVY